MLRGYSQIQDIVSIGIKPILKIYCNSPKKALHVRWTVNLITIIILDEHTSYNTHLVLNFSLTNCVLE